MIEHYFSKKPRSSEKPVTFSLDFEKNKFTFISPGSVFSKGKLDKGSEVLLSTLNKIKFSKNASILDLGCGYGIIGIIAKKLLPDANVTLTDINKRAVKYSKQNAKINNVAVKIVQGNIYESTGDAKFDLVLLNPPQTAGKEICFSMIEQTKEHLQKNGKLIMVARHKKGGKSLEEKMKLVFGNVDTISKKSGFRVYQSILI